MKTFPVKTNAHKKFDSSVPFTMVTNGHGVHSYSIKFDGISLVDQWLKLMIKSLQRVY